MNTIHCGDALDVLQGFDDQSVNCIVTSPPYFGLRDYGVAGQLGLESTVQEYVRNLVSVFREARRVLKDDGTFWLNLGDSYARSAGNEESKFVTSYTNSTGHRRVMDSGGSPSKQNKPPQGYKAKEKIGIPWRVAFALQDDGWLLRSDIIWHKPNPMPESVKDRPTTAHEYVFLFVKQPRYWYDATAIREPAVKGAAGSRFDQGKTKMAKRNPESVGKGPRAGDRKQDDLGKATYTGFNARYKAQENDEFRNARSVWTIPPKPYREAHFATFPEELARRCIVAGCPEGGTVLDPFFGSGTTGKVARDNGRNFAGIELNPEYINLSVKRVGEPVEVFGL